MMEECFHVAMDRVEGLVWDLKWLPSHLLQCACRTLMGPLFHALWPVWDGITLFSLWRMAQ